MTSEKSGYQKVVEGFHHRLRNLMEETFEVLAADKPLQDLRVKVAEPFRCDAEETSYHLYIEAAAPDVARKHGVDIAYALYRGDEAGLEGVVSFGIEIVGAENVVLGGLAPYKHSDRFWIAVDDEKAIRERLRAIEEIWSPLQAASVTAKFLKEEAS